MPTTKEIEEAKAYIRRRMEAENSMRNNLERYMRQAAERIVDIAYRYNIPPSQFRFSADKRLKEDVDRVIAWLKTQIQDASYTLAIAADEENGEDTLLPYVSAAHYGKTFARRNDLYCQRFKFELEGAIAAGLLIGAARDKLKQSVYDNFHAPYANPIFRQALKDRSVATRLQSNGISYGVGHTNAMYNALELLSTQTISSAWMKHWGDLNAGAQGFYSYRGSRYPCALCDSMVGWHPMSDYRGGWHPRCCCYFVFA